MPQRTSFSFEVSTSGRDDGTIEAVYVRLSGRKIARTRELREDVLLGDYDARGALIGLEILAPVRLSDLSKFVDDSRRRPFRRFLRQAVPEPFLMAS